MGTSRQRLTTLSAATRTQNLHFPISGAYLVKKVGRRFSIVGRFRFYVRPTVDDGREHIPYGLLTFNRPVRLNFVTSYGFSLAFSLFSSRKEAVEYWGKPRAALVKPDLVADRI